MYAEEAVLQAERVATPEDEGDRTVRPSDFQQVDRIDVGYDASVDWWSFGVALFEMVIGRAPFHAHSIKETYDKIALIEAPLPWPIDKSPSLEVKDIIRR